MSDQEIIILNVISGNIARIFLFSFTGAKLVICNLALSLRVIYQFLPFIFPSFPSMSISVRPRTRHLQLPYPRDVPQQAVNKCPVTWKTHGRQTPR